MNRKKRKPVAVSDKQKRINYFIALADNIPEDVENRDSLYKAYMEHVDGIRREKVYGKESQGNR